MNVATSAKAARSKEQIRQRYTIAFMRRTEADLIEKLETVPNRAGYIKALIRRDLAANPLHDPGDTAAPADLPNVAPTEAEAESDF